MWWFALELYYPFEGDLWAQQGLDRMICRFCKGSFSSGYSNFQKHIGTHKDDILLKKSFTDYACWCTTFGETHRELLGEGYSSDIDYHKLTDEEREDICESKELMKKVKKTRKGGGTARLWKLSFDQIKKQQRKIIKKSLKIPVKSKMLAEFTGSDPDILKKFRKRMSLFKCGANLSANAIEHNQIIAETLSVCNKYLITFT